MTETRIEFDHPLNRFYLKPKLRGWEAWQYGWKTSDDEKPDYLLGCFMSKEAAIKAVEDREEWEKERFGVWRFFVDD